MGAVKQLLLNLEEALGEQDAKRVFDMVMKHPDFGLDSFIYLAPQEIPKPEVKDGDTVRHDD